jgi:Ribosomal protein L4/L1 family
MSAKVLSKAAAKEAKIDLIEDGRGTQAVHDAVVAMRAARRSGSANTKSKAEVDLSGAKPWRQKEQVAPGPVTNHRRFGGAVVSFLARSRAIIRRKLESLFVDSLFEKR